MDSTVLVPRIRQDIQIKNVSFLEKETCHQKSPFLPMDLISPGLGSIRVRKKGNQDPLGPGKKWKEALGEIN